MRVVFDTNVLLDALLGREPFAAPALHLLRKAERRTLTGALSASSVTTLAYLGEKAVGRARARQQVGDLLDLLEVAPVDEIVLRRALDPRYPDYEDGVVCEAASRWGAEALVTRDTQGFRRCPVTVYSPDQLLELV